MENKLTDKALASECARPEGDFIVTTSDSAQQIGGMRVVNLYKRLLEIAIFFLIF